MTTRVVKYIHVCPACREIHEVDYVEGTTPTSNLALCLPCRMRGRTFEEGDVFSETVRKVTEVLSEIKKSGE